MFKHDAKLRLRRKFRKQKRNISDAGQRTEERFEKLFVRRLNRLVDVRRFVVGWVGLVVLLSGLVVAQTRSLGRLYLENVPVPGGTYTEGILGAFTNANPLYASSAVDTAMSQLLFAGLMHYDASNQLTGDLAERYEVSEDGEVYTVVLREDLTWHDGEPVTAEDVAFTYRTIQNPDALSPLLVSWQGIKVEAIDEKTVTFTLPNALASFPHSLTNGIVPKHQLAGVDVTQLRSIPFNTVQPVGTGPFKWDTIEVNGTTPLDREETIGLVANTEYHFGQPKINYFVVRTFRDETRMITSLQERELNAVVGLEMMPDTLPDSEYTRYNIPLTGQVNVFFKTSQAPFDDPKVRQALAHAIDAGAIVKDLGFSAVRSNGPLLKTHIGYNPDIVQRTYDVEAARKLLDEAGWTVQRDNIRYKEGKPLIFRIYSQSTSEYADVTGELQRYWQDVGVKADVILQTASDLQSTISQHNYDVLLYGISLGTDPDVFPYWHSSQAAPRANGWLNFSEYQSSVADDALEAGRTRSDLTLRSVKYQPFLQAWRDDVPALSLYQPRFLYISRNPVAGFEPDRFNVPSDRYNTVHLWMIKQDQAVKSLE